MSKPYTEADFSNQLDADFTWRVRELSDLKTAVARTIPSGRSVLLRAVVALLYAHWEGYTKLCVHKYFDFISLRKRKFQELEAQLYINSFLLRLDALSSQRTGLKERCELVSDIISNIGNRFTRINPSLVDTHSNLNTKTLRELCLMCSIDYSLFSDEEDFIDRSLVRRRNEIAHGEEVYIEAEDIDGLVSRSITLMRTFRNALENKIYSKTYAV